MNSDTLTQLGVGAVFVIIVLREVFSFLNGKKNNAADHVTRAEFDHHKNGVQYKANCAEIVKRFDASFKTAEKRFDKVDAGMANIAKLIRDNK